VSVILLTTTVPGILWFSREVRHHYIYNTDGLKIPESTSWHWSKSYYPDKRHIEKILAEMGFIRVILAAYQGLSRCDRNLQKCECISA
jgi:hypothetical protein